MASKRRDFMKQNELKLCSCEYIMETEFKKKRYLVDKMLYPGLYILAGATKVGKSWLAMQLCVSVALGEQFLKHETSQGQAVYLALEDDEGRLQNRVYEFIDVPTENLEFAIASETIDSGLEHQIRSLGETHDNLKLVIIDTMQMVRETTDINYAKDYKDMSVLKNLATELGKDLEDVFRLCNTELPYGYHGHSLSVSDVVEICDGKDKGLYFVDSIGFKKLDDFDITQTDHEDMMKVLILEKDRLPYEAEIKHNIYAMQHIVGGAFDIVYFEPKDDAICFCNDEFLLNGSQPNRVIGDTLVHGTCFIAGNGMNDYGEYDSCSLTDEQIRKYTDKFGQSVILGEELAVPTQDESQEETIEQTLT